MRAHIAKRLAEATFGAWLAGEDETFGEKAAALANIVGERGIPGFAFFTDCARRSLRTEPESNELPKWVICGHLIAYGNVEDAGGAAVHARAALEGGCVHATPNLIALALAEVSQGSERAALYDEARAAANTIASPEFIEAVGLAARGQRDVGILTPYFEKRVPIRGESPQPRLQGYADGDLRSHGLKRNP
jgi:hypothetical protein